MLQGTDGIDLMKDTAETGDVPVIFLTTYGQDELFARAFDMGAAKPFSPMELSAGVRAALRRSEVSKLSEPLCVGRSDHRLDRAPGISRRSPGLADHQRVRDAGRACGQRQARADIRASAETGLGA